jgi:hypothetical protein
MGQEFETAVLKLLRDIQRRQCAIEAKLGLTPLKTADETMLNVSGPPAPKKNDSELKELAESTRCDRCGEPMLPRYKRGEGTPFFGCSAFPKCKNSKSVPKDGTAPREAPGGVRGDPNLKPTTLEELRRDMSTGENLRFGDMDDDVLQEHLKYERKW